MQEGPPTELYEFQEYEAEQERAQKRIEQHRSDFEMTDRKWYESPDNVYDLAQWLDGEGYFDKTSDMLRFFEKPWKWIREFGLYQLWQKAVHPQLEELCVEAVFDNSKTAEDILAEQEENDEPNQ